MSIRSDIDVNPEGLGSLLRDPIVRLRQSRTISRVHWDQSIRIVMLVGIDKVEPLAIEVSLQPRRFSIHAQRECVWPRVRHLHDKMKRGVTTSRGLEHRSSTSALCKRDELPPPGMTEPVDDYISLLGLVSHEYFHVYNIKRIKPAAFTPYDLSRENYTRLLWAFEGFTAYYDDLALVRSGVIAPERYLELLGRTITSVLRTPGRLRQSLSESSFDAWIKFYRKDENTPNAVVSYYVKGAAIALALDLMLRKSASSLTPSAAPFQLSMTTRCGSSRIALYQSRS